MEMIGDLTKAARAAAEKQANRESTASEYLLSVVQARPMFFQRVIAAGLEVTEEKLTADQFYNGMVNILTDLATTAHDRRVRWQLPLGSRQGIEDTAVTLGWAVPEPQVQPSADFLADELVPHIRVLTDEGRRVVGDWLRLKTGQPLQTGEQQHPEPAI